MSTTEQTLQSEIAGTEKAIRLLIGEQNALTNKHKREEALLKLEQAKLKALKLPKLVPVGAIPSGQRFPDVSHYQPNVDFKTVAADKGAKFGQLAITKLTEGSADVDAYGKLRIGEIKSAGFEHAGAYCFGHPGEGGVAMAEHFLASGGSELGPTDVVVYDCEVTDGERPAIVAQAAQDFGNYIAEHSAARRWLYGGGPFLRENDVTLAGFTAHWLAAYVADYLNPEYMIFGRAHTIACQYTDGVNGLTPHVVAGIGASDLSIVL